MIKETTISKQIFSNKNEEQLFNKLPFFALYKNRNNLGYNRTLDNNGNHKKISDKMLKEDFLYKISHDNNKFNNNSKTIQKIKTYTCIQFKKRYKEKKDLGLENRNKIEIGRASCRERV